MSKLLFAALLLSGCWVTPSDAGLLKFTIRGTVGATTPAVGLPPPTRPVIVAGLPFIISFYLEDMDPPTHVSPTHFFYLTPITYIFIGNGFNEQTTLDTVQMTISPNLAADFYFAPRFNPTGDFMQIGFSGPVLWTGTTEAPHFTPGTYTLGNLATRRSIYYAGGIEFGAGDASLAGGTATLTIEEVPEPASAALFASALLGLGLVRRRRRG